MDFYEILLRMKLKYLNGNLCWYENLFANIINGLAVLMAKILKIKGNTIVWNQNISNGDFSNGTTGWTFSDSIAGSVSSKTLTLTMGSTVHSSLSISHSYTMKSGHKYLCIAKINPSKAVGTRLLDSGVASGLTTMTLTANAWNQYSSFATMTSDYAFTLYYNTNQVLATSDTVKFRTINLFDLTQMFGSGNEPSTLDEFTSLFPLDYYAYDSGSLLSFNGTGIKTQTKNLCPKPTIISNGRLMLYGKDETENYPETWVLLPKGTYTVHGSYGKELPGTPVAYYRTSYKKQLSQIAGGTHVFTTTGFSFKFTLTQTTKVELFLYTSLVSASDYDLDKLTVQVELGSTATPYVPYSSSVTCFSTGKNYLTMDSTKWGNYGTNTSGYEPNNTRLSPCNYDIPFEVGQTYTLYADNFYSSDSSKKLYCAVNFFNDSTRIFDSTWTTLPYSFTPTSATKRVTVVLRFNDNSSMVGIPSEIGKTILPQILKADEHQLSYYFPTGMKSAGSVYDELTKDKAITRIGSRAYESGDESDSSVITDGTTTYYALATPTEVNISPPLDMNYQIEWGGTEQLLPENGSVPVTSPILADIKYPDGERDNQYFTIREVEQTQVQLNMALSTLLGRNVSVDNPIEPLDIIMRGE